MFSLAFKRLYYVGDKLIVRNLRNRRVPPGANPGLQKRLDAFAADGFHVSGDDAEEFVETSESDFFKVGEAYNEHLNETISGKEKLRHHIVKDKYFKENMPNLLTWSEKEQIRHLATTEPDEWTPEKIAESFPVTVPVVKKLLKYPWKPATRERIARHDASAMRNWRELKEGMSDIPRDLQKHLLKFAERTIPPLEQKSIKIDLTQEIKMGEFESIVKKCAAKDEKTEQNDNTSLELSTQETEPAKHEKVYRVSKRVTLDELTDKIKKRLDAGNDLNMNDSLILNTVTCNTNESTVALTEELSKEIDLESDSRSGSTELTNLKQDMIKPVDYTMRIRIPKKAYVKGATYKVNDSYYDCNGKFLYRVLGMSNTN